MASDVRSSLLPVLQATLIVLKLTGVIDWSWWWVLTPLWIVPLGLSALIAGFFLLAFVQKRRVKRLGARLWRDSMSQLRTGPPEGADATAYGYWRMVSIQPGLGTNGSNRRAKRSSNE
jgi:Transmembrane Fragile-X-F protein